jgi:hypothetical protein
VCREEEETAQEIHRVNVGLPRRERLGAQLDREPDVGVVRVVEVDRDRLGDGLEYADVSW